MTFQDGPKARTNVAVTALALATMASACGLGEKGSDWEREALENLQEYHDTPLQQVAIDELVSNADASLPPFLTANSVCVESYWTDEQAALCVLNADELGVTVWEGENNYLDISISSNVTRSDVIERRRGRNPTPLDALSYGGISPDMWILAANEGSLYATDLQIYYPEKSILIEFGVSPEMGPIKSESANVYENAIWLSDKIGFTDS